MLSGREKEMGENNDAEVEGDVGEVRVWVTYVSRGALPWTPLDSLRRKSSKGPWRKAA